MFAANKPDIKIAHASFCSLHDLKMKMRRGKPRNRGCRMLTSWTLYIVSKIFPFIYYMCSSLFLIHKRCELENKWINSFLKLSWKLFDHLLSNEIPKLMSLRMSKCTWVISFNIYETNYYSNDPLKFKLASWNSHFLSRKQKAIAVYFYG